MFDTIEKPLNLFTWATVTYPKITINFIALSVHSDLLTLIKCRPFGFICWINWRLLHGFKWFPLNRGSELLFTRSGEVASQACFTHLDVDYVKLMFAIWFHWLDTFFSRSRTPGPASLIRFHYVFLYVPEGGGVLVHLNVTSSLSSLVPVKTRISERSLNLALKARLITYLLTDCVISSQHFPVRFLFWLESKKRLRGCLFYKIELTAP